MSYPRENVITKRATGTANQAATIELPEVGSSLRYRLRRILYGYGGTGTPAGTLTIQDGATESVSLPVAALGSQWLPLGWQAQASSAVTVTLSAGGTAVTSSLVLVYTVE